MNWSLARAETPTHTSFCTPLCLQLDFYQDPNSASKRGLRNCNHESCNHPCPHPSMGPYTSKRLFSPPTRKNDVDKMHEGLGAAPAMNKNMEKTLALRFPNFPQKDQTYHKLSSLIIGLLVSCSLGFQGVCDTLSHSSKLPECHWNDGKTSMMQVWLCNTAPVHVSVPNTWTNRAWGELKMVNMSGKNLKNNMKYAMGWFPWCMSCFSSCGFLILAFLAFPSKAVSQRVQREYMLMAMHPEALLHLNSCFWFP